MVWILGGASIFVLLLLVSSLVYLNHLSSERRLLGEVVAMSGEQQALIGKIAYDAYRLEELSEDERESLKESELRESVDLSQSLYDEMRVLMRRSGITTREESGKLLKSHPFGLDEKFSTCLSHARNLLWQDAEASLEARSSLAYFRRGAHREVVDTLSALVSEVRASLIRNHDTTRAVSAAVVSFSSVGVLATLLLGAVPVFRRIRGELRVQDARFSETRGERDRILGYVDDCGVILFALDKSGMIEFLNQSGEEILGTPRRDALGRSWCDLFVAETFREELRQTFTSMYSGEKKIRSLEFPVRTAFGKEILLGGVPSVRRNDLGEPVGLVMAAIDIGQHREAEKRAVQAKDEAERANLAKTQFLANLSHDLRSPMNAILGFTEVLLENDLPTSDKLNYLALIRRNGHHLLSLINDLLDLSRIEAGGMKVEPENFALLEFVNDVISDFEPQASSKGLELEIRSTSPVPEVIRTDRTRLRQIVNNLLGNAIKYTPRGRVELRLNLDDSELGIHVIDTGPGIAPAHQERLFEAFERLNQSVPGTGLGLVIARRLSRQLGGDVWLEWSRPGRGSEFGVRIQIGGVGEVALLPPVRSKRDWLRLSEAVRSRAEVRLEGRKILIVDDSVDNLLLFERFLKRSGADVTAVETGSDALAKTGQIRFDLLLLDIQLPDLSGYEVAERLRGGGFRAPIVALTAHALPGEVERCRKAGCDGYLTKPISGRRLIERVAMFLAASREAGESSRSA